MKLKEIIKKYIELEVRHKKLVKEYNDDLYRKPEEQKHSDLVMFQTSQAIKNSREILDNLLNSEVEIIQ